jgi:glyoxylase-like metal-dependent hydrolase (beta-lactamase superfamily II)
VKCLAAAIAAATIGLPASAGCDILAYQRVQASPHVILFQSPEGTTGIVNGNTVAIIGRDAVLVVDPGQFPTTAERILAEIRKATAAPVKYVVNSHWHGDHLLANSAYREAFPQAKIIAHPHTIAEGARYYGGDYVAKTKKAITDISAQFRKEREAAPDDRRLWIDNTLDCAEAAMPDLDRTRYVAPDTPWERDLDLDLGGVSASVRHLGTGNTPGDLVVWVPEDRLLATGDIVVYPAPYAIGSSLAPWPATIDRMLALSPAVIVPGHGPMMRDDRYVRDLRALIVGTQAQMQAMLAGGVARKEAPARIDTRAFREKYIATPMQREAFDQFFVRSAVSAAWPKEPPASGSPPAS